MSRTIYYKWLKRFNKLGYLGLPDKKKVIPKKPNQIKKDKEQIILNYIINCFTHGPRRIANKLKQQEVVISDTGVYNILRRKSLNYHLVLTEFSMLKEESNNPVATKR